MTTEREATAVPTFDRLDPTPLIEGRQSLASLTDSLLTPVQQAPGRIWKTLFIVTSLGTLFLVFCIVVVVMVGIESLGNNIPVAWGFPITNFVWWIGFGHAGTLISAILVLFQQKWRASIHRFAEAMTLAAVVQAGLFPILHLGRPWFFYWVFPYPTTLNVYPNFKSSLPWDAIAVLTYFLVSLMYWYMALIPDLAAARDHATSPRRKFWYAVFALGWTGSAREWFHWKIAYVVTAGLATALVLSVESIVSTDFATALVPHWNETIFPPYFVASAMYSGFALLLAMLLPARSVLAFKHVVTEKHINLLSKMVLLFSFFVTYGYVSAHFFAWYSGDVFEMFVLLFKRTGFWSPLWYAQILTTSIIPQLLWIPRLRTNVTVVWFIALGIIVGAWLEQFLHIVPPLARDFLPSSWDLYFPTWVDFGLLFGTACFFGWLMLLFVRFVPPLPVSEVKELFHELREDSEEEAEELEAKGEERKARRALAGRAEG